MKLNNQSWQDILETTIACFSFGDPSRRSFLEANAQTVKAVVAGSSDMRGDTGACLVFNISAAHIPAFCGTRNEPGEYLNAYDLESMRVGDKKVSERRKTVDTALEDVHGGDKENIYFGAIEINGPGIRFYGDFCLVLKKEYVSDDLRLLDRNSYDLVHPPLSDSDGPLAGMSLGEKAKCLSGVWGSDLPVIAAIKVLETTTTSTRRLTSGQVSDAVRSDEDYLEVLKPDSFDHASVEEVRVSSADVTAELEIDDGQRRGVPEDAAALLWRSQRLGARQALADIGVDVRIVTTPGRVKG